VIKLLLADDSTTIQRVVELTFSGEDVQVIAVGDGEQAIARIPVEKPDIIMADIAMPTRNGYDVAAFVQGRADLARTPVLLLAGAFEPVDEARAKEVGSAGVLVKPFEPQEVISRVRALVGGAKADPAPDGAGGSVDDYFNRLDAAFATLGSASRAVTPVPQGDASGGGSQEVPTVKDLLGDGAMRGPSANLPMEFGRVTLPPLEPPDMTPTLSAAPGPQPADDRRDPPAGPAAHALAELFRALLAAEQGDAGALRRFQPAPAAPAVTDDLVDEVTRRVLARLSPQAARDVVADVVADVAERLVREEIERIKSGRPNV
jgi:CheY-like chemotaxis protein